MNSIIGILFGVVSMFGFGFQNFFQVKLVKKYGPFRFSLWLLGIATIMILIFAPFLYNYSPLSLFIISIILLTAIFDFIGIFAFTKGQQVGNLSVVVTIANAWAAVTVVLGVVLLHEILSAFQIFDIALIIIGTVLVSLELKNLSRSATRVRKLGVECALVTVFGWGFFYFLLSFLISSIGWFPAALLETAASAMVFLAYGIISKRELALPKVALPYLLFICVLNFIGFIAFNIGVTYNYAAVVAPITAASPIVVILLAGFLLKERLEKNQIIGIAMVLIGIILLSA